MSYRYGVDLGGTKIEGVVFDADDPSQVLARCRVPTEPQKGYEHIIKTLDELIQNLEQVSGTSRPIKIGFGTPGSIDRRTGLLKNSNTQCLNGRPLEEDLTESLGVQVRLANDANCFALAESTLGCAREFESVFGVILGTGVGGGLVWKSDVQNGHHGIAGEWGHNVLDQEGLPCYCGKKGCVETVLAGPSLERYYTNLTGFDLSLREIVSRARAKSDAAAVETLDHLIDSFGRALSVVVNIFDPDAIVLGGGVGNVDELYTLGLTSLSKWVFTTDFSAKLLKPSLGDSAGVFGAAML